MIFIGAGVPVAFGIPALIDMTGIVGESLPKDSKALEQFELVSKELAAQGFSTDIENVLSALEALSDPMRIREEIGPKVAALSGGKPLEVFCDIPDLSSKIKQKIKELCTSPDYEKAEAFYSMLFKAAEASINEIRPFVSGIEGFTRSIVTTNYDVTIEESLSQLDRSYSDGFAWDDPSKRLKFVSSWGGNEIQLVKMHGSVDYHQDEHGLIVKDPAKEKIGRQRKLSDILVYPAGEKSIMTYPYYDLYHRFNELLRGQVRVLALGFSFRDLAIRNMFVDWLRRNPKALLLNYARSARKRQTFFPPDISDRVISRDRDLTGKDWLAGFGADLKG